MHFTIKKKGGFVAYQQVDLLFELLNKTVDGIYQYYSCRSRFFRRTFYRYIKIVSGSRCKYYHFAIFRYDHP